MSLSRRGLLGAFLAAPAVITIPNLLMPISAKFIDASAQFGVSGPGSTTATSREIAIRQRAAYGLVEIAPGCSVPLDDCRVGTLPSYYEWVVSSPEDRAKYWEEPPVAPESWDWSIVESSRVLRIERERLAEARLRARPKPITPAYINLINRSEQPFPPDYVPLRPDVLETLYNGRRVNPFSPYVFRHAA
jgi:hypothetical protein